MARPERTEYNFILRPIAEPDEDSDGIYDPDQKADGYQFLSVPFNPDDDPQALLELALEQVGVYDASDFEIGGETEGGFIVHDAEGEPFLSLECDDGLEVEDNPVNGLPPGMR
jgi:hypothetical protein